MAAEPQKQETETPVPKRGRRFDRDTLNLVVASCAVLISAASFVATYVQSKASLEQAEASFRQVKAQTWPLLQLDSSNYDDQSKTETISLTLENAGVGPAQVRTFSLAYDGKPVPDALALLEACCLPVEELAKIGRRIDMVTSTPAPRILPAGGQLKLFAIPRNNENAALWDLLDKERFKLAPHACYCSLLDECFETDFVVDPVPVKACRPKLESDYRG